MAQFYEQEILLKLMYNDPGFGMTFRGLRYVQHIKSGDSAPSVWDENRIFEIESPSMLWNLHHVLFPKYILKRPLVSDEYMKGKMCKYLEDERLCPDQRFNVNMTLFDRALDNIYEMRESGDYSPKLIGTYFRNMLIEHTSSSTLANAHSMTKAFAFMFNLISEQTKALMFGDVITDYDIALDANTSFSIGGFGRFMINGVEWFGWSGWGGSTMMYAPEYDCVMAYAVTAFTRSESSDWRKFVVTNLISQFLTK